MTDTQVWICPLCKEPLQRLGKQYICSNQHQYDTAKQGYVNLLLANMKKSKQPGDSSHMIAARSAFLSAGHFDFLATKLADLIGRGNGQHVLDMGCGEGFYLRKMAETLSHCGHRYWGIDISKAGIKRASGKQVEANFAVASCIDVPVADHVIDVVLSVFSPCSSTEVFRVLKPEGRFIRVSPGPRHLWQLKEMLYDTARLHEKPKLSDGECIKSEYIVKKRVTLCREDLQNLLSMTPLFWRRREEAKERVTDSDKLDVDLEFLTQEIVFNG